MDSDIYQYKGMYEGSVILVSYLDYPREHPDNKGICGIQLFRDNAWIYLSQEDQEKVSGEIVAGKIPLEYTGGWCPSGGVWDANGNAIEEDGD